MQGFGVSRDMRSEAAEGAASAQHGERRDGTERRGGDMATRFIRGMIAEGLPKIAGAVPVAGGVVVEVDTALEPERGDLVACSTADDCPSAPQIARIRRVDAEAGTVGGAAVGHGPRGRHGGTGRQTGGRAYR